MYNKSTLVLAVACLVLMPVSPWLSVALLLLVLAIGTAAVFAMLFTVTEHLPQGMSRMANDMTCAFVQSLVSDDEGRGSAQLPSFVTAGGGSRQPDYLKELYASPAFQMLCKAISLLGPLPCFPAYRYVERRAE